MKKLQVLIGALLIVAVAASCASKKADQAAESAGDSLLSASPVEPPQGNMTPSQQYQQQQNPQAQTPAAPVPTPKPAPSRPAPRHVERAAPSNPGVNVPAGTAVKISVDAQISSETAQAGDAWQGKVTDAVVIGTAAPIPAGSVVRGVVKAVKPAKAGDRAMLQLAVTEIEVEGKSHPIHATGEEIVAGSTRARNVGAVAGGAAAGALIGKAIGGSNKGALIGGLIGGAAATGAVASTKGYQVVIKEGADINFTTDEAVTLRQ